MKSELKKEKLKSDGVIYVGVGPNKSPTNSKIKQKK